MKLKSLLTTASRNFFRNFTNAAGNVNPSICISFMTGVGIPILGQTSDRNAEPRILVLNL